MAFEIEPKTGVSFPTKLEDGKHLIATGLRKKSVMGMSFKVYAFGIYADYDKLKDVAKEKIGRAPAKPTKEVYQMVIDSDVAFVVRFVFTHSGITMSNAKKGFEETLGEAMKKLTGKKNPELTKKVMGELSDDLKLTTDIIFEISRLPGYKLQTKVMGEVMTEINNEELCRAYVYLYLGDDPFDKESKEKFGASLLSLF